MPPVTMQLDFDAAAQCDRVELLYTHPSSRTGRRFASRTLSGAHE
jgi:hypothetical protein